MINKIKITDEIKQAIAESKAVVALESTIITHGLPYPNNLETASLLEQTIRDQGAIPATIAILNGTIHIGLTKQELEFISKSKDFKKASRRDLPVILAKNLNASTTVSATMICASLAGIKFFATGGIGGVHRGATSTFDISADLQEFVHTQVLVVCAGPKAILDIPLTMEYLETLGVPVLAYKSDKIPAFYYADSGVKAAARVDSPEEAASSFAISQKLGYKGGILVANPVPEEYELDRFLIEGKISEALAKAEEQGIMGQALTPFLLAELYTITEGASVKTNVALVRNNAAVCAQIAVAYYKERHDEKDD